MMEYIKTLFLTYQGVNTVMAIVVFISSATAIVISSIQFRKSQLAASSHT